MKNNAVDYYRKGLQSGHYLCPVCRNVAKNGGKKDKPIGRMMKRSARQVERDDIRQAESDYDPAGDAAEASLANCEMGLPCDCEAWLEE